MISPLHAGPVEALMPRKKERLARSNTVTRMVERVCNSDQVEVVNFRRRHAFASNFVSKSRHLSPWRYHASSQIENKKVVGDIDIAAYVSSTSEWDVKGQNLREVGMRDRVVRRWNLLYLISFIDKAMPVIMYNDTCASQRR